MSRRAGRQAESWDDLSNMWAGGGGPVQFADAVGDSKSKFLRTVPAAALPNTLEPRLSAEHAAYHTTYSEPKSQLAATRRLQAGHSSWEYSVGKIRPPKWRSREKIGRRQRPNTAPGQRRHDSGGGGNPPRPGMQYAATAASMGPCDDNDEQPPPYREAPGPGDAMGGTNPWIGPTSGGTQQERAAAQAAAASRGGGRAPRMPARAPETLRPLRGSASSKVKKRGGGGGGGGGEQEDGLLVTIAAVVEDAYTSLPLPGATVSVSTKPRGQALLTMTTTSAGEVRGVLKLPAPMKLHFSASCARYGTRRRALLAPALDAAAGGGKSGGGEEAATFVTLKMEPLEIEAKLRIEVFEGGRRPAGAAEHGAKDAAKGGSGSGSGDGRGGHADVHPDALQGAEVTVALDASAARVEGVGEDGVLCVGRSNTRGVVTASLALLCACKCRVTARKAGFRPASAVLAVSEAEDSTELVLRLEMIRTAILAPLAIRVVDGGTGRALPGATVRVERGPPGELAQGGAKQHDGAEGGHGELVVLGVADARGEVHAVVSSAGPASLAVWVRHAGWQGARHFLQLECSDALECAVALQPPPAVEVVVEVGGMEGTVGSGKARKAKPLGAVMVSLVNGDTGVVEARGLTSTGKGIARLLVQSEQLGRLVVEVSKEGWADGTAPALSPAAREEIAESGAAALAAAGMAYGGGGGGDAQPVRVGLTLSRTSHAHMATELLVAVGSAENTIGMLNVDKAKTTLREVRARLRAERLRGLVPIAYHFCMPCGAACGVESEAHHRAAECAPVLVLRPLQMVRGSVKRLTAQNMVLRWEPPPLLLEAMLTARRRAAKTMRLAQRAPSLGDGHSADGSEEEGEDGEFHPFGDVVGPHAPATADGDDKAGAPDDGVASDLVGFCVEMRCGLEVDERRCPLATLMGDGNGGPSKSSACELLIDGFGGRPLQQGRQYDVVIRSALPDREVEDVVPLSLRVPMFSGEAGGGGGAEDDGMGGNTEIEAAAKGKGKFAAFTKSILFHPSSSQVTVASRAPSSGHARGALLLAPASHASPSLTHSLAPSLATSVRASAARLCCPPLQWAAGANAERTLSEIAVLLRKHPEVRLQVRGYCNSGLDNLNLEEELSWSRAANVCEYLVAAGANAAQLELEGKSSSNMLVPPTSKKAWKNRRVEFFPIW
jgi:hypothetical protein